MYTVTHEWRTALVEEQIVDRHRRRIIHVHAHRVQARPDLGDLGRRGSRFRAEASSHLEPFEHLWIAWWVVGVNFRHRSPSVMHEEVGSSRALDCISSAAEAASLVDHEPLFSERPVPAKLSQLSPKVLVVRHDVEHSSSHRGARCLEDRSSLSHLLRAHVAHRRPPAAVHRIVEGPHVVAVVVDERTVARTQRRPRMIVREPKLWLASSFALINHRVGVAANRPEWDRLVHVRPPLVDTRLDA